MTRSCDACGRDYLAKRPSSRFCTDLCRKRASRNPRLVKPAPKAKPKKSSAKAAAGGEPVQPDVTEYSVTRRTIARIEELELADDPQAAVAVALARRLDSNAETGSAVASLAKQLSIVLEELRRRGKRKDDPLDEIRRRREAKARGA